MGFTLTDKKLITTNIVFQEILGKSRNRPNKIWVYEDSKSTIDQ